MTRTTKRKYDVGLSLLKFWDLINYMCCVERTGYRGFLDFFKISLNWSFTHFHFNPFVPLFRCSDLILVDLYFLDLDANIRYDEGILKDS